MNNQDALSNKTLSLIGRGWVSLRQFAILIGISYPTALRYREDGKINAIRIGGIYRVYEDEIQRFLKHGDSPEGEIPSGVPLQKDGDDWE